MEGEDLGDFVEQEASEEEKKKQEEDEQLCRDVSEATGYTIDNKISEGGFCDIFKAKDKYGRTVALKVSFDEQRHRHNVLREGELLERLRHPNIIFGIEHGTAQFRDRQLNYLVEEYVNGTDLDAVIQYNQGLGIRNSIDFMEKICGVFDYLHSQGLVFIDVKPDNIIITPERELKLIDLATAQEIPYVHKGVMMGAPQYLTIDYFNRDFLDAASDIYPLGIMLYYMLAGEVPFEKHAREEYGEHWESSVFTYHLYGSRPDIRDVLATAPAGLPGIVKKAMAVNRSERYQSAAELWHDLEKVAG